MSLITLNKDVENKVLTFQEAKIQLLTPSYLKRLKDFRKMKSFEQILNFFNYGLEFMNGKNYGGGFDIENRRIIINDYSVDDNYFETVISHEISHIIQFEHGDSKRWLDSNLLSDSVRTEQECEVIATEIHSLFFKSRYQVTYFSLNDIKWLSEYYEDYKENDLLLKN